MLDLTFNQSPRQRCCFCGESTSFTHGAPGDFNMPCCQLCAKEASSADLPPRAVYTAASAVVARSRAHVFNIGDPVVWGFAGTALYGIVTAVITDMGQEYVHAHVWFGSDGKCFTGAYASVAEVKHTTYQELAKRILGSPVE